MKANQQPNGQSISPFAQLIMKHWKANFPKEARRLEQQGQLIPAAERAAESASLAHEQALEKGLSWSQAEELSVEAWGNPPGL
jgi:hypothetical protein